MSAPKFAEAQQQPPPYDAGHSNPYPAQPYPGQPVGQPGGQPYPPPGVAPYPGPYPPQGQGPYPPPGQGPYPPQGQAPGPYPQQAYPAYQGQPAHGGYPPVQVPPPGVGQQTIIISPPRYTGIPVDTTCPHCHATIVTSIEYRSGIFTWILCCALVIFGCVWGCCLIPFCVDSCKDCVHSCPNCNRQIGEYRRI